MGRIRSYRPDLWDSDQFTSLSADAQLCLLRLMSHVSDQGRIKCVENFLIGRLYPNGERSRAQLACYLCELLDSELVTGYEVEGKPYLEIQWNEPTCPIKQVISRPTPCKLPGSKTKGVTPLMEWLNEELRERLQQARRSDSIGTGRDRTGPDWTGTDSPGRDRTVLPDSGGGLRSGSGSAEGLASATPAEEAEAEEERKLLAALKREYSNGNKESATLIRSHRDEHPDIWLMEARGFFEELAATNGHTEDA